MPAAPHYEGRSMHKTKEGALKAARKELGKDAAEGSDFTLSNSGAGWVFEAVSESPPEPKAVKKARASANAQVAKSNTKSQHMKGLLTRPEGATSAQMEEATGWQPHSVRGLLGTWRKKGVKIEATKIKGSPTVYRIVTEVEDVI